MKQLYLTPEGIEDDFDAIEIHPVKELSLGVCEVCDEGDEDFYSVYVHMKSGGVSCIADVPTKELAIQLEEIIIKCIRHYSPE